MRDGWRPQGMKNINPFSVDSSAHLDSLLKNWFSIETRMTVIKSNQTDEIGGSGPQAIDLSQGRLTIFLHSKRRSERRQSYTKHLNSEVNWTWLITTAAVGSSGFASGVYCSINHIKYQVKLNGRAVFLYWFERNSVRTTLASARCLKLTRPIKEFSSFSLDWT